MTGSITSRTGEITVDVALWDLRARLLGVSLSSLFGQFRNAVPVYGSAGFITLNTQQLHDQIRTWTDAGCTAMKIKIRQSWGSDEIRDLARVRQLRSATSSTTSAWCGSKNRSAATTSRASPWSATP